MIDISLIVATYGRYQEVDKFLDSISRQEYDLKKIEVIIADQNDNIDLAPVVEKYKDRYTINHIRVSEKGLSKSKNLGIEAASGAIVSFPDDDCCFYPDTVSNAIRFFDRHPGTDVIYGKVYDRESGENIMREWLNHEKKLNLKNFHLNYSSIACFSRKKDLTFDTHFGVGAYYGSGEELDYVITAIKRKYTVVYTPSVEVWHPQLNVQSMNADKVYRYAKGYAAVLKKHVCPELLVLLTGSIGMQVVLLAKAILALNKPDIRKRRFAIAGRLAGFYEFKRS